MYLINGQTCDLLPVNDRAIQFGDGCFTTARIAKGKVCFYEQHLHRLQQGCRALQITFNQWAILAQEMQLLARQAPDAVLKVIISRGAGGRGYSIANCHTPTRILSLSPLPEFYNSWKMQGIILALSPVRLGINPHLAGIKHLNRLEQVLVRLHLEQTAAQEALVIDSNGMLVECCAANVFWRKGHQVFTPDLNGAGVNGIMRQHIIKQLEHSVWQLTEVQAKPDDLAGADEVIICNSLMPVVPVNQVDGWQYQSRELYHFVSPFCN